MEDEISAHSQFSFKLVGDIIDKDVSLNICVLTTKPNLCIILIYLQYKIWLVPAFDPPESHANSPSLHLHDFFKLNSNFKNYM